MTKNTRKSTVQKWATVALTTAGLGVALAAPASAQAEPSPSTPTRSKADRHCVVRVSQSAKMTCHESFRTAMADATGGRITDAPGNASAAARDPKFNARVEALAGAGARKTARLADQYVLSIEYEHSNFGGSSIIFTGTRLCTTTLSDVDFQVPDIGWHDEISSFRTFSFCWVNHFADGIGSQQTGFQSTQEYIGDAMNDKTSALQWS